MGPSNQQQQNAQTPNEVLRDRLQAAKELGLLEGSQWTHTERGDSVRVVTAALDDDKRPVVVFTWDGITFVRKAGHFMARFKPLPNGNRETRPVGQIVKDFVEKHTPTDKETLRVLDGGDVLGEHQHQKLKVADGGFHEVPVVVTRWREVRIITGGDERQWYVAHVGIEELRKELSGHWYSTSMFVQG